MKTHYKQAEKYGKASVKELPDGRTRNYGEVTPATKQGEMAGRRVVREWNPSNGNKRTWHETVDHSSNIRQVRPDTKVTNGKKFIINLIVRGNTLENGDVMNLPSIQDLLTKLQLVLINELQREEVADYAAQYVMNDDYEVQDEELWELLNIVSGIDLKDSPDEYLHDERDIRDWIHRFQRK